MRSGCPSLTVPVAAPTPLAPPKASALPTRIPLRFHPRVFAALGADLVTSDIVAVMELVKNSYDAGARTVTVRFGDGSPVPDYLEIEDDGCGMSRDIIENVWCVVATPHKADNPMITSPSGQRRVSGEKGLGRLSAARLGDEFRMWTRSAGEACWEVSASWPSLAESDDPADSVVELRPYAGDFPQPGTRIRVGKLKMEWGEEQIEELQAKLSRLVSPFSQVEDFMILLSPPSSHVSPLPVEPLKFLSEPKYRVEGSVNLEGDVAASYSFLPLSSKGEPRDCDYSMSWAQVCDGLKKRDRPVHYDGIPRCGPFTFEIRAWDIDSAGTNEIAARFGLTKKRDIREAIRSHNGISVYRDGILVLPKSDRARDWLGLDLRRVSKVGPRLSTNQIVGLVSVSSDHNPNLRDTSDRENLAAGPGLTDFRFILLAILERLEVERDRDRRDLMPDRPLGDLFDALSAAPVVAEVRELAQRRSAAEAIVAPVERYARESAETVTTIQKRLIHYSRLATVGTIAELLVHEIRNRTTSIGRFLTSMKERLVRSRIQRLIDQRDRAERAVESLESLSDRFAPLASRSYRRGTRTSVVEERIRECLELEKQRMRRLAIQCDVPSSRTVVAVDPGEMDAVLLNLITNALYWLSGVRDRRRRIVFEVERRESDGRIAVRVSDSGPGIEEEDLERVFLPGVTRRPGGIGMGLTVAAELVAAYGGRMSTASMEGGALFLFDLPSAESS